MWGGWYLPLCRIDPSLTTVCELDCDTWESCALVPGAVVSSWIHRRSCSGMMGATPNIIAAWMLCLSAGVNPVWVRLLESCLEVRGGNLMTLPDVVSVTGEEAPEAWPLKTDVTQRAGCDSFLPPAIWSQVRFKVWLWQFSGDFLSCDKTVDAWFVFAISPENHFTPQ